MDPNNGGYGVNSGMNYTGDMVASSFPSPRKPIKKIALIAMSIIIAIAVIVFLITFFVIKPNRGSVSEVYSRLWNFYYDASYQDLVENYNVGIARMERARESEFPLLFPFTEGWIEQIERNLDTVKSSYSEMENTKTGSLSNDQKKLFNEASKGAKFTVDTIESNLNTISKFYDAFIAPLNALDEGKALSCSKNNEMTSLINDSNTSDAANKYYAVYCKVVDGYSGVDDWDALMNNVSSQTINAAESLDTLLEEVDKTVDEKIKKLLDELEE